MKKIASILSESIRIKEELKKKEYLSLLKKLVKVAKDALKREKKIILCGNGGSAADCQHFAAELIGRFKKERKPLPALSLTTNSSILTSISNDYSFQESFSRQIEALGKKGDLLIAISTSGRSKNILEAINTAKKKGIKTVLLTGRSYPSPVCFANSRQGKQQWKDANATSHQKEIDLVIAVPSSDTARIQEAHITILHILAELLE